jgi:hypothetical protein
MFGIPVWFLISALALYTALVFFVVFIKVYTVKLPEPGHIEWQEEPRFIECDHCTQPCEWDTCPAIN